MDNTIILTGGGTAGHIMPNLALIPYLKSFFSDIVYLGQDGSLEQRLSSKNYLPFHAVPSIKLERGKFWRNLKIPFALKNGVKIAKDVLSAVLPSVVFCKGGYVCLPTAIACKKMNIPYVIHESDCTIGLANRLMAKSASYIITSHKSTPRRDSRYLYVGNPIRRELISGNKAQLSKELSVRREYRNILVFGGSLGAKSINDLVSRTLDALTENYNVLHITGNNSNYGTNTIDGYYPVPFVDNIGDYYALADLIISRSGASAISEISACGKPVIYIPLPKGSSRGDQLENARQLATKSGNYILEQDKATPDKLLDMISVAFSSPSPMTSYDPNIPKAIVDIIVRASINK